MPPQHLFYIPMVFTLGLAMGLALPRLRRSATSRGSGSALSGWWVVAALAATAVIFVLTHIVAPFGGVHAVASAAHGNPVFDQQPSFSAADIYGRLEAFGPAGREAYQAMTYSSDVLFPASLLVSLLLLGRYFAGRAGAAPALRRWLITLPLAWFAADMLENAMIHALISAYPAQMHWAPALGAVTVLKTALLLAAIIAIALSAWRRPEGAGRAA